MAGEVGDVMVQVSNPLQVELRVARMSLISEGVTLESSSTNLTLPPMSGPNNINLSLTPREEGRLTLRGYCHNVLGVTSECLLSDQMMEGGSQSVTVIPPLPLVTMTVEQRLGDKWNMVSSSPVHLYSGETVQFRVTVKNVGSIPVGELSLNCNIGDTSPGTPVPVISVKSDSISKFLPLAPDNQMTITVEMTGVVDYMTSVATLKQEDDNMSSNSDGRWSFSLPSSSFRSNITTPAPTGHPSLMSVTSCGSGGSSAPAPAPLTSLQTVSVSLQYAGDPTTAVHCRRCLQQVSIVQIPSLIVTRWDVLPGDTQQNCFLVLDLVNRTHTEMELQYTERKSLLIEPGDMCRVPVPVVKCSFSDSLEWDGAGGHRVVDYLGSCVNLSWSIITQDAHSGEEISRTGVANLDNITWTDNMLDLIRRPPLVSTIKVNDREVVEGGEVDLSVGEVIMVDLKMINQLLEPVCDAELCVRLLQDTMGRGGAGGGQLTGAAGAGAGTPGLGKVQEVLPGDQVSHVTSLLALTPGTFKLVVSAQVKFRDKVHSWRLAPVTINIKIS